MKVHEYSCLIRERHLDTFGHVNNAQYLMLFEEARWEMITSRGYGMKEVHAHQVGTVVLECSVRFKRELTLREKVTIKTWVGELRSRLAKIRHELIKENGEVAAEAEFTMGCFDLQERKLISPTESWLLAIGAELPEKKS
jgi:YbgC/YbaW family acyl-CoA thioester hydrolase